MAKKRRVEEEDDPELRKLHEDALTLLIEKRRRLVDHHKDRMTHHQTQMLDSEKRLRAAESKLSTVRSSAPTPTTTTVVVVDLSSPIKPQSTSMSNPPRPLILLPAPLKLKEEKNLDPSPPPKKSFIITHKQEDLGKVCASSSSTELLHFGFSQYLPSGHKRKLRSLALNPANGHLFLTSALDGVVIIYKLKNEGDAVSILGIRDCMSPNLRKWPEEVTWHPDGESIFAAYSGDGDDSQVSILNVDSSSVNFLEAKPHSKGSINNISFMPWEDLCFGTAGSDHAVVVWTSKEGTWIPKTVHRTEHSSAVMGVYGLHHKKMIVSVGADKRLVGFDLVSGVSEFKHQIDSKCMAVLPNPCDWNLFLVQTGARERQLRLFDIRSKPKEILAFGFKQESSDSNSTLIKPAWSPDGLRISSGSMDPVIHLFDIRYNSSGPAQSLRAHQKRVFKADWHRSHPLLVSISSDLHIGLNRIT